MSLVASFEIRYTQFLGPSGEVVEEPLPPFAQDPATLIALYQLMALTRTFDAKAIALQRTGQLGTYPPSVGQEAVGAGVGTAMRPEDVLVPSYREQAAQFARGVTMTELLLYWGGDERGSDFEGPREDFPVCIPIGSHACHAVGVATAFKLRHQPRVAVCVCGDGATSRGDFYESINLAGVWTLPVVFVVNNNQWAISVPRRAQSAAETLAQKALGAGFAGEQVDGNDVIAVRWALERGLKKARSGGGPTMVEALTYRLHSHTTADDASRYRDDAEVSAHWTLDPIARMRRYLNSLGIWDKQDEQQWLHECAERVRAAEEAYLATPPQEPTVMFDYLYHNLPAALAGQRASSLAEGKDPESH